MRLPDRNDRLCLISVGTSRTIWEKTKDKSRSSDPSVIVSGPHEPLQPLPSSHF